MSHRVTVALSPQKMGQISHLLQRENPARRRHLTYGHNRASPKNAAAVNDLRSVERRFRRFVVFFAQKQVLEL